MMMKHDKTLRSGGFSTLFSNRITRRIAPGLKHATAAGLFMLIAGAAGSCESSTASNADHQEVPTPTQTENDLDPRQRPDERSAESGSLAEDSLDVLYDRGKKAISNSEYGKAIDLLQKVASARPDDVELHYWLGVTYWNREQGAQAIQAYQRAIALDPEAHSEWSLYALGNLAEVYTRTDHAKEARDTYRQALLIETRPEWITKIHNQIVELDLGLGEFVPNRDTVYNERGEIIGGVGPGLMHTNRNFEIARQTNDPVKEEKYYRLAIETDGQMYQPYFNLGLAIFHQGRFEDALPWLEKSDEVWKGDSYSNPRQTDKTDAQAFLALCYVELGDLERASEHIRRALATSEPNYWATLYSLRVKIESGQAEETLSQLQRLTRTNPEHTETLFTLSLAYEATGEHEDAMSMLHQAIDSIPENHPWMGRLRTEWQQLRLEKE